MTIASVTLYFPSVRRRPLGSATDRMSASWSGACPRRWLERPENRECKTKERAHHGSRLQRRPRRRASSATSPLPRPDGRHRRRRARRGARLDGDRLAGPRVRTGPPRPSRLALSRLQYARSRSRARRAGGDLGAAETRRREVRRGVRRVVRLGVPSRGPPRSPSRGSPRSPSRGSPRSPSRGPPRSPSRGPPWSPSRGPPSLRPRTLLLSRRSTFWIA